MRGNYMHYLIVIGAVILLPLTLYKLLQPAAFSESTEKQILGVELISSFMISSPFLLYALDTLVFCIQLYSSSLSPPLIIFLYMMLYSFTILLFNPFSITFFRAYFKDKLTPDSNRNISVFILISTVLITMYSVVAVINTK
jgi:hypothetical protein